MIVKRTESDLRQRSVFVAGIAVTLLCVATRLAVAQGGWEPGDGWREQYKVGDRVELKINATMWQRCKVIGNNPVSAMRLECEEYVEAPPGRYRRAGGIYTNSSKNDIRKEAAANGGSPGGFLKRGVSGIIGAARGKTESQTRWGSGDEWRGEFEVGDKVQFSISGKAADFQTCTVTENDPQFVMRIKCAAYKQWEAGTYIVHSQNEIRSMKAGAKKEPEPSNVGSQRSKPSTTPPSQRTGPPSAGLKIGEYACYGAGGRILAGLGFKVLAGNRYTDLDGGNRGSFSIVGDTVRFRGGHLGGQVGRELRGHNFRIGAQASCEPF
jgi:hypothetical protein